MNTTKEMREKLRQQCRAGMTDMVSPFQALSNASARNLCETIMALLDDIEELQQAEKQAAQASSARECHYEKLHQAAVLALEVIEKHRQMQGEAPMGMLGYRAIKVLEDAIFEPEQDAPMSNDKLVQATRPASPEIDYMALIRAGFERHKYRHGTRLCVAFKNGAEWFREQVAAHADAPADAQHQPDGANPNNRQACDNKQHPDGCVCYMFSDEPPAQPTGGK